MSARTGKRGTIRRLDPREDLYEIFGAQQGCERSPETVPVEEEPFSRLLEDTLSGADQTEMIRQKNQEADVPALQKKQAPSAGDARAELDLHGCHVHEALVRVESFIETAALQGLTAVRIIVGKGLHSQGSAVLPDAVEAKIVALKRKGRIETFAWEKKQKLASGALVVYLKVAVRP